MIAHEERTAGERNPSACGAHRRPACALVAALAVVAALAAPAPSSAQAAVGESLDRLATLEHALLEQAQAERREAIEAQADALQALRSANAELEASAAVLGPERDASEVERLREAWDEAMAAWRQASVELAEASRRLERATSLTDTHAERWLALRAEADSLLERSRRQEPLSGTWDVVVGPTNDRGTFDLTQDGALLSGRYSLASGRTGSVTGTAIDGKVRLDRIDSRAGRDAIFFGIWQPDRGTLSGTWEARALGTGQPAHGSWRARRQTEGEDGAARELSAPAPTEAARGAAEP